jgi:16S rRNA processing protein RimM
MKLFAAGEFIGNIEEVREFPQQEMAIIIRKNSEILIPLNASLIEAIDKEANTVEMNLPEGLLEM